MRRIDGNRARLGGVMLAAALAAAAILALPGVGLGKNGKGPRPAGTIKSFDAESGELLVDLAKGGEISGLVVRRTRIRCGEEGRKHRRRHRLRKRGHRKAASASDRGERESGQDRRGPEDEVGDDRGGPESEVGDDRGGPESEVGDGRGRPAGEDGEHNHRHGDGRHGHCNAGDLVEGATVMRAEIVLAHGNAFYKAIGLLPSQAAPEGGEEAPEGEEETE